MAEVELNAQLLDRRFLLLLFLQTGHLSLLHTARFLIATHLLASCAPGEVAKERVATLALLDLGLVERALFLLRA